jgi:Mrp family chromosome partitioning ATPase
MMDGVIVVLRAGETSKDHTIQAKKLLYGVNAKILGVVLNGVSASDLRYGSYGYYYSYYYEDGYGYGNKKKKKDKKDTKNNQTTEAV